MRPWVSTAFVPGPQPTYTSSHGDDPNFVKPPPVGFQTIQPEAEPITWEGDHT